MISSLHLKKWLLVTTTIISIVVCSLPVVAQNARMVQGVILDPQKHPVVGSTVQVKETNVSTTSDTEGKFSLSVPAGKRVLVISYVGKVTQEVTLGNQNSVSITLNDNATEMDAVVVVGYGRQKKESVVGAITQTTGKVLQRAGGVSNIGAALTGNVPGVITVQGTGMPGAEDPTIYIRGHGTWNNSGPLF